ncbi:conjugal transfer protein TraB [Streptomyces roseoverticillatus]|uniref:conjugal transfer protein TraB n=1 Tax=Streptomyces roseoverticillatus TaxID=66429 RepID=UPI001F26361A|nr:conjugal transfer protein TraB [Streptomyces roseoverticillatus]MCF3105406.1 conjugal transfer protein TraB [Streptomyces roseoverticillatus]
MTDLVPHTGSAAPALADDDNRYKAVQAKLGKLTQALDDADDELEALRRAMKATAARAECVAGDIENADLDAKFVSVTDDVALALGGATAEVKALGDTAQEVATLAHQAKGTHAKLYGALDDIRSSRPEKTPRPGFFNR